MEEKELIERLRICSKTYHVHCGVSCDNKVCGSCRNVLMAEAVDLIHRLQDENKQLKSNKFASWKLKFFRLKEEFDKELSEHEEFTKKAKAEIERLTEENGQLKGYNSGLEYELEIKQKQVDELKERAKIDLENEKNWGKIQTKQAVKDTAKEIYTDLLKEFSIRKSCGNADVVVREMATRKGVEVE